MDYGQPAGAAEYRAAMAIASHYGVTLRVLVLNGSRLKAPGLLAGRNSMLLSLALIENPHARLIVIGIHAGTRYFDCSPAFVAAMQSVVDGDMDGGCQISAPFVAWSKRQVWELAVANEVPLELTHSCESAATPCGTCMSCLDREALRARS